MDLSNAAELKERLHQQQVVADFGQRALQTGDLDSLMHDACVAVAETLDTEYVGALELVPDEDEVLLRQGVGWRDGLVGSATVPIDLASQAGYTFVTEEPVIVDDLRTETRFSGAELLASHDVVSGVSVIIGSVEHPWGVLSTHTTEQRGFTGYDATFVQSIANVLASAIKRRERERSLELFRTLLDHSTDAVFVEDPETGRILDVNAATTACLGYDRDELLELTVQDIDLEMPTQDAYRAFVDELKAAGQLAIEGVYRRKDGSTFPAEITASHVELDQPYVLAMSRDVSEQRERAHELERAHQRMEVALHVRDATVWEWEPGSDEVITHPEPHGLFGTEVSTIDDFLSAIHPDDRSAARAALDRAVETGSRYRMEFRYRDGESVRWAEDYGELFEPADGEDRRMIGIVRDITERKRREHELEEANWRYRALVNHFPNGAVALFDEDLRFTATGGELLDEPKSDDPLGDTLMEHYPAELVATVEPHFQATLAGEPSEFEVEYLDRHFLARTVPVRNVANEQFAGMVVLLDVTERRKYRRRLEESHERLEEFVSAISHDLREPLGTVANYLQLLERRYEEELDEDAEEFIDFAVGGATRMREMIDGLVTTYARIEGGDDPLVPVDLEEVVDAVLVDLQGKIDESGATVAIDSLPTVQGERGQLRQLFLNLVDNAIKYAGDAPPNVRVSAEREGGMWVIRIRDEGIGMDPAATDEVFEVFHRLHPEDEYPGTGIGLALCERIVERHGGDIWADAEPGAGSTFSFTLPASDGGW